MVMKRKIMSIMMMVAMLFSMNITAFAVDRIERLSRMLCGLVRIWIVIASALRRAEMALLQLP